MTNLEANLGILIGTAYTKFSASCCRSIIIYPSSAKLNILLLTGTISGDFCYSVKFIQMNRTIGLIMIALGVVMLIWTGFTYTKKEKVIDAGPIQVSADKEKSVNWPPYAGGILLIGGVIIFATAKKAD